MYSNKLIYKKIQDKYRENSADQPEDTKDIYKFKKITNNVFKYMLCVNLYII